MARFLHRPLLAAGLLFAATYLLAAQAPPDLADHRTVATALTCTPARAAPAAGGPERTGYLGVAVTRDAQGRLVVEDVQPDSPGARAGVKKGDLVSRVGDRPVATPQDLREWLQTYGPGTAVKLGLVRDGQAVELTATLAATSRPMSAKGGKGGKGGMGAKGGKKGFA